MGVGRLRDPIFNVVGVDVVTLSTVDSVLIDGKAASKSRTRSVHPQTDMVEMAP